MLNNIKSIIITYYNQVEVIATEKVFNQKGIGGRIINTPRYIEAGCGLSYSISKDKKEEALKVLNEEKIKFDKIIEL